MSDFMSSIRLSNQEVEEKKHMKNQGLGLCCFIPELILSNLSRKHLVANDLWRISNIKKIIQKYWVFFVFCFVFLAKLCEFQEAELRYMKLHIGIEYMSSVKNIE